MQEKDSQSKTWHKKKVQLEEEKLNEAEDTTLHIICGQSFAQDEAEEEMTVQLQFFSVTGCHGPCTMDTLSHVVMKFRKI